MKAKFKSNRATDDCAKKFAMGAASSAFENSNLDLERASSVKLVHYLFHRLDGRLIVALEKNLGMSAPEKRNIRRLVGKVAEHNPTLEEILKPIRRTNHNTRYRIFGHICQISAGYQPQDAGFLRRLKTIGISLNVSEEEMTRLIDKTGLSC